jgi:hypothetical protein
MFRAERMKSNGQYCSSSEYSSNDYRWVHRSLMCANPEAEMVQTVWAHGIGLQGDPAALTNLTVNAFGTQATAVSSGAHDVRIMIPGPATIGRIPIQISRVALRYKTTGTASIISVSVYDCELQIDTYNFSPGLTSFHYITSWFIAGGGTPIPITNGAVSLTIVLSFPSGGSDISGAGFEFIENNLS